MEVYRKMIISDLNQVYEIEADAFLEPWSYEALTQEVNNENAFYMVLEIAGHIIGYAGLWKIFNEGHVTNMAIKAEYRGKGYGQQLMEALHNFSRKCGIDQFTLEVRVSNQSAIGLYEKLGYVTTGIRKGFYERPKEDALIMWLK